MVMRLDSLKEFLDEKVELYNRPAFIEKDPISIPHQFRLPQDIEIMGFFAAILAWGQRPTIIKKCNELISRMEGEPFRFIVESTEKDLRSLEGFKHRTFNDTDLLYCIDFLKRHYKNHSSLETAFAGPGVTTIEEALIHFRNYFFDHEYAPHRTKKHIASPAQKSACKRLNMYLRWMVRKDDCGVDFGLWERIQPASLICPIDLHVDRTARAYGLIHRKQTDWLTALELTQNLRNLDAEDPVKYDFALFGISVEGKLV